MGNCHPEKNNVDRGVAEVYIDFRVNIYIIYPANEVRGGYIGLTLSVCLSVPCQ